MHKRTIARISIATGSAALCLAVASPAMACTVPAASYAGFFESTNPLTPAIAKADATIAAQQKRLAGDATKVGADPNLSSAQISQFAALIAAAQAQLATEKAAVDSATSTDEVKADLASTTNQSAEAAVSLAMAIVSANDRIVNDQNGLTALATKLANDPGLTAGQKSDLATLISTVAAGLQTDRANANAATSTAAVRAADKAADSASGPIYLRVAIDRADNQIDAAQAQLSSWSSAVTAATDLTDQQKADAGAKISAAQAALTALRAKVDAATSTGQVAALLGAAQFDQRPWQGDDPAKLPRHPQPVAQPKPNPASVTVNRPATTVAVQTDDQSGPVSHNNNGGRTGDGRNAGPHTDHNDRGGQRGSGGHANHR